MLFLLAWIAPVHAAGNIDFNVDFFCGWDECYRPMEWTPVEIGITSDLKEPFSGTFTVTARQDGLNTLNVIHPFVLTPDQPLTVPLATKFAFGTDRCNLAIHDEKGRLRWRLALNTWDFSARSRTLRVVQEQDLLVGLIGQAQFGILRLPQETTCLSGRGTGKVYLGTKVLRAAPWDWTGYASLDLLVICDPDWSLLRAQQLQAIREWISNGGTALVILGQHPLSPDNPLTDFLPFRIEGPRQVELPALTLQDWGLAGAAAQTVTAWSLSPRPDAVVTMQAQAPGAGCIYGMGYAGFGRVAVLGFSPSQLGEEHLRRSATFWTQQIGACCGFETSGASHPPSGGGRRIVLAEQASPQTGRNPGDNHYRISVAQGASNQVMEYLYALAQMRPLSIWWIVLTLMALAVLLGPVDYLVLKRLDKLPYTWLTSTAWIVIFTVGAYYGVQWFRGGAMEIRAISVLDGIADSNCAWATNYVSLFAPRSGDYRLAGLAPNQWWSGIAPTREDLWGYQRDAGLQQIHCRQSDGGNLPVSLPVNMWTVQPLLSEGAVGRIPFAASVERQWGQVTVRVENTSDSPIQRGYILFDDACADLGSVPPHTQRQFNVQTRPFQAWQQGSTQPAYSPRGQGAAVAVDAQTPRYPDALGRSEQSAFLAQGCLSRSLAMHAYLDSGAALVCVVYENAPIPIEVQGRAYSVNHIQLARQLVLPER
ncbi:MAG: hypothetical protein MUC88_22835 [Planctomycetes bacterium]|nr:hypothetical protein [Planctomycetota bacterium]